METVRRRRSEGREQFYRSARRLAWVFSALVAAAILCLLFLIWLFPTRIEGDSMTPALEDGEVVLCDRFAKYWKTPGRGDMILFETADGLFIKQIVALPEETVEIVDGHVFIDSCPLDEDAYVNHCVGDMAPLVVPAGCVFVLGDNRSEMYDSRLETVGCISRADIKGVLRVRIAPLSRFTFFS